MKKQLNSKLIVILLFTQLLFSYKNNISAGVDSDGKNLDSTGTNSETTTVTKNSLKVLKDSDMFVAYFATKLNRSRIEKIFYVLPKFLFTRTYNMNFQFTKPFNLV